jgi:DeoR family ulaG and ulaABCDEF operon transcriptional repressor
MSAMAVKAATTNFGETTRPMRERQRVEILRNLLAAQGFLSIADVMAATGVSAASARRDAGRLAEAGYGERVYGGVQALGGAMSRGMTQASLGTQSFDVSRAVNVEAKRAIARRAVDMCVDGDAIIVNGGTTTFQMAEFLRHRRLKILTNSYPLAEFLIHETQNRVALPGGEVYREQKIIVAPFDDDATQHYSARIMFMSAISIGLHGVIEGDPLIARAEAKLLRRADKLVVLADASKFAQRGSLVVCPLTRIDALITDRAAPPEALAMLRDADVETIVVDPETRVTEAA